MSPDDASNPRPQSGTPLPDLDGHTTVPVTLSILGLRVSGAARVPSGSTGVKEMLPAFRVVADAVVRLTERSITQHGGKVSCAKGCGACCRQVVPVACSEAHRLREVIRAMPEPRRGVVLARFAAAEQRVRDAGLHDLLASPESCPTEELEGAPMAYFHLGIACPFLEDESCSIYDERPLACREYLVTSPASYCSTPDERVAVARMPLKASEALARLDGTQGVRYVKRVPLTLSLRFADEHPERPDSRTGPAILDEFMAHLERTRPAAE